jgi:hypothetical protein
MSAHAAGRPPLIQPWDSAFTTEVALVDLGGPSEG